MADDLLKGSGPFDVRTVKALVALMSEHDLSEIYLSNGKAKVRLRRGMAVQAVAAPSPAVVAAPAVASAKPDAAAEPAPSPSQAPTKKLTDIKSPTVGTFYASSSPDAQPFVRVGDRVGPTTVVCLIEAMKLFNEITADCAGIITEILIQNQQPVEFGQVLFRVDPG